jgi:hypothetical protein
VKRREGRPLTRKELLFSLSVAGVIFAIMFLPVIGASYPAVKRYFIGPYGTYLMVWLCLILGGLAYGASRERSKRGD